MKKNHILLVILAFLPSIVLAQYSSKNIQSKGGKVIHEINFCYTSQQVDSLLEVHKEEEGFIPIKLTDEEFNSLNVMQGLIYALEYPESYHQICMRFAPDYEWDKKIHANLQSTIQGAVMSKRQLNYLKNNRDTVVSYINFCIGGLNYASTPIKKLIVDMNMVECIPNIMKLVRIPGYFDTYNLTVLMKLMTKNNYKPFLDSVIYNDVYGKKANYKTSISFSRKRVDNILFYSEQFFNTL